MAFCSAHFKVIFFAAFADMAVGCLWYSEFLFGKMWMKLSGCKSMKGEGLYKALAMGFVASCLMAAVMLCFAHRLGVANPQAGAMFAAHLWLGFVLPVGLSAVIWAGKKMELMALCSFQCLVSMVAMGAVIGHML